MKIGLTAADMNRLEQAARVSMGCHDLDAPASPPAHSPALRLAIGLSIAAIVLFAAISLISLASSGAEAIRVTPPIISPAQALHRNFG